MGAIAVWIVEHARQIAAWTILIGAIAALAYGIASSNAYQTLTTHLSAAAGWWQHGITAGSSVVQYVNASFADAKTGDAGWVSLIYYCLYMRGFTEIVALVVGNLQALVVSIIACWAVIWRVILLFFAYTRTVALVRVMSNGEILTPK